MLDTLDRAVDALVDLDLSGCSDSELRETYIEMRRDIDRREAFVARVLACLHGRGIPAGDGASSTPAWARWQTGQRFNEARASLDAGKACDRLPLTAKAWSEGAISASAARTICRGQRAGHEDVYTELEETLVDYAARRDLRGLDLLISHFHALADALDDIDPADQNGLHLSKVLNRWGVNGSFDDFAGTTVNEAVSAATDPPLEGDTRSPAKRRADALVTVARFFLDHADLPVEGGERPHITVVVGWEDARDDFAAAYPSPHFDTPFAPADIRQLLCDARISRMILGPDNIPLSISHATYSPPPSLRRAVVVRDRHCRFPGCDRPASWSQAHHVGRWPHGPTSLENLALLCGFHHRLVHTPGWRDTFDGITYTVYNGSRLVGSTRAPPMSRDDEFRPRTRSSVRTHSVREDPNMSHAVVVLVEIAPGSDVAHRHAILEQYVIPEVKALAGFQRATWMNDGAGTGMCIVTFDTEANANAAIPTLTPAGGPKVFTATVYAVEIAA
jgi:hypothetical protein